MLLCLHFRHINFELTALYPETGKYVEVFNSSSVKGEYGLRARLPIPAMTMIGFYEGSVVDNAKVTPPL